MGSAGGAEQARPTDRAQLPGERLTAGCAGGGVSRGRVLQARWAPGLATIEPLDAPGWGPKPSPRTLARAETTFFLPQQVLSTGYVAKIIESTVRASRPAHALAR